VSDYVLGRSRELHWIRSQRIHHFINTDRFRPDSTARRDVRRALGVGDEFVMIAIAYLIKDKGIDVVIRAIAVLPERVMLWIVGDGPELHSLETLARNLGLERRLRFLGSRSRVEPFLQGADCFVCPSLWAEAAGLVNLEAMACGLPVVASRIGGIPELVRDEETGLLFTPGDQDELAQRLLGLLHDEQFRSVMGQRARNLTLERFSIPSQIDEYLSLYRTE
jgi:glycosyltransferase involved in cell wall biosynthesis